ncbi:MAG: hypothetical protein ACRENL_12500 [Candidatus Dormibacteria bacterium]
MDQVSMNDGLDGRETIAFGLGAGEIAVLVLALLTGYAVLRSGLVGAVAWSLAVLLAVTGTALAWGRLGGRPLLEWAVLLVRFLVRTRHARAARWRALWRARVSGARAGAFRDGWRRSLGGGSARPLRAGAVVVPLALRRADGDPVPTPAAAMVRPRRMAVVEGGTGPSAPLPAGRGDRGHVVGFFSLNGGTGRTTLAVELAAMLAVRGHAAAASGGPGLRVALLDLCERSPAVGLRLGIPPPGSDHASPPPPGGLLSHASGLLVGLPAGACGTAATASPEARLDAALDAGAGVVVVDVDCDLGARCRQVLQRCDQVLVTMTPTAGGVLDAYRSTAVLRRQGLRDRIGYVVNRWRPGIDLAEPMGDLGGVIAAEIPDDLAFAGAENRHAIAGLEGGGGLSDALGRLAVVVEAAAGLGGRWLAEPRWDSHAG